MSMGRRGDYNAYYMQSCPLGAQVNSLAVDPGRVRSKLPVYRQSIDGVQESQYLDRWIRHQRVPCNSREMQLKFIGSILRMHEGKPWNTNVQNSV